MTTRFLSGQSWRWREAVHLPGQRKKPTLFVLGNGEDPFAERMSSLDLETMFRAFRSNLRTHKFLIVVENATRAKERLVGYKLPTNVTLAARVAAQSDVTDVLVPALRIEAAHHAVLIDPLVSPIEVPSKLFASRSGHDSGVGWVIVGCSPAKAGKRLLRSDYLLNLIHDCDDAGTPIWVHNVGAAFRDHAMPCNVCGEDELAHDHGQGTSPFSSEPTDINHAYEAENIVRMLLEQNGADAMEWPAAMRRQQRPSWLSV